MNNLFRNMTSNTANYARDRASWEGASIIERQTFGRLFNFAGGALGLIFLFGCVLISGAIGDKSPVFLYLCGALWLIPFIAAGVLLARFRMAIFVRVRSMISGFMGGGPR